MIGSCKICAAYGPVVHVTYRQNTGLLLARMAEHLSGKLCKACSVRCCRDMTTHNVMFGWWGLTSLVITPLFVLANLWSLWTTLGMQSRTVARSTLHDHRVYALNLLEVKDPAIVAEVIQKDTRLPLAEVEAWVRSLTPTVAEVRPPLGDPRPTTVGPLRAFMLQHGDLDLFPEPVLRLHDAGRCREARAELRRHTVREESRARRRLQQRGLRNLALWAEPIHGLPSPSGWAGFGTRLDVVVDHPPDLHTAVVTVTVFGLGVVPLKAFLVRDGPSGEPPAPIGRVEIPNAAWGTNDQGILAAFVASAATLGLIVLIVIARWT